MKAETYTITPDTAAQFLEKSAGNRVQKQAKIASYGRDMMAGNWVLNGEPIIFDVDGTLIDGHHRLSACVASGVTIESMVVTGAPRDSNKTIDMGASRTSADALSFYGIKNPSETGAVVRFLMNLKNGRPRSANPSTQEVFAFIDEHPEVVQAASFVGSHKSNRNGAGIGAIYFACIKDGTTEQAHKFAAVFKTGVPAYPGCPAHVLRERMIRDEMKSHRIPIRDFQILLMAAWEKFRVGAPVKVLKAPNRFYLHGWSE